VRSIRARHTPVTFCPAEMRSLRWVRSSEIGYISRPGLLRRLFGFLDIYIPSLVLLVVGSLGLSGLGQSHRSDIGSETREKRGKEALDKRGGTLVGILGLLGVDGTSTKGRESVLLSNIDAGFTGKTLLQSVVEEFAFRDMRLAGNFLREDWNRSYDECGGGMSVEHPRADAKTHSQWSVPQQ